MDRVRDLPGVPGAPRRGQGAQARHARVHRAAACARGGRVVKNADKTLVEADVYVNGWPLDFAQSMTLRVAISSFLMCCQTPELGEIGPLYAERCREILKFI